MKMIRREITIALLKLARWTATTSAAKYYCNTALEYEEAFR